MGTDMYHSVEIQKAGRFASMLLFLLLAGGTALAANPDLLPGPHKIKLDGFTERNGAAVDDRAIGLMDKGQLSNVISNFGVVSNFHTATPALHWPRNGTDVQHYSFGISLLVLADGTLVKSIPDPSSATQDYSWEALDGSLGTLFNDVRTEENTSGDEVTPLLASSDRPATWPVIDGEPQWPGPWRTDLDDPTETVPNEFTSDRDIYSVLQDRRGLDLRVEQLAYSYSRPYAEDILFVRFLIHNESSSDYNEVYTGFQVDLKPDFFADDRIAAWNGDPTDPVPSFIFKQDLNGVAQRDDSSHFAENWVGPVGWIGMGILNTPDDAGVTSFHYYHDDNSPVTDEGFAGLLTNDATAFDNPENYFHGNDASYDDLSLQQQIDLDALPGSEPTFTIGTGPFNLPAGEMRELSIAIVIGADSTELRRNVDTAYLMGRQAHFQGSGPPTTPYLRATAGDGQVLLTWDAAAERSRDAITDLYDFEGYRLFKSTDGGITWGDPLTNWFGMPVGFVPLVQYDLIDSLTGLDPAYGPNFPEAHAWLGEDTGLQHSYLDRDVVNGQEVWYSLTSYDQGRYDPDNPGSAEPSYESPRGISPFDQNTVAVVPGTISPDYLPGDLMQPTEINGLEADGQIGIEIVDESLLSGHTYQVSFNENDTLFIAGDTLYETTMNLTDLTTNSTQFRDMHSGSLFEYTHYRLGSDDLPAVDGFRPVIVDIPNAGVSQMGWTTVNDDSSTFDWWVENRAPGNVNSFEEIVEGIADWRVTVVGQTTRIGMIGVGFMDAPVDSFDVPIRVEVTDATTDGGWRDVTEYTWLGDLRLVFDNPSLMGPLGWDLVPGGLAWNPNNTGDIWPDILILRDDQDDETGSLLYLKTQNGPDTTIAPSQGDVYTLITDKPFTGDHRYEFVTEEAAISETANLSKIKVVPNPYIVRSGFERDENDARVMFTHLPTECEITIYTVAGQIVNTIKHRSATGDGFAYWDVRNKNGQDIAYGVYVYIVKTPNGQKQTGKLMVIR
ncbi:hypothetical protein KQI63_14765 [bacterium]|nr:hypothetical protein [bacterium]